MGISAVIIAFNEEAKIGDCIRSVDWADEVLVVDSHSTDRTREIAASLGAKVIEREWPGFAAQKQFATTAAAYDLIFSLDADEVVSNELADEILSIDLGSEDAFRMPRLSHYLSKPIRHGTWYPDRQIRLFDRRHCTWSSDAVHESVIVPSGKIGDLNSDLLHFSSEGIVHHAAMIQERYAPLGAEKLRQRGQRIGVWNLVTAGPAAFLSGYLFKLGFLDGVRGLMIATFAAYNAFLKYAIRYEQQLDKETSPDAPDTTAFDTESS